MPNQLSHCLQSGNFQTNQKRTLQPSHNTSSFTFWTAGIANTHKLILFIFYELFIKQVRRVHKMTQSNSFQTQHSKYLLRLLLKVCNKLLFICFTVFQIKVDTLQRNSCHYSKFVICTINQKLFSLYLKTGLFLLTMIVSSIQLYIILLPSVLCFIRSFKDERKSRNSQTKGTYILNLHFIIPTELLYKIHV